MENDRVAVEAKEKISAKLEAYRGLFSTMDATVLDLDKKLEEVQYLIDHVNQRIVYTESRITRAVTFAITLIGIGMAFFAVTIKLVGLSFYLGLITTGLFILTGSITAIIHAFQINPKYPFRKFESDWKWFYPNIVHEEYKPSTFVVEREKEYWRKRSLHVDGLYEYAKSVINEDKTERLKVDIQQLYLLHVNEKYKNCFLTSLRKVLTIGLILTSIALFVLFVRITSEQIWSSESRAKSPASEQTKPPIVQEKVPAREFKLPSKEEKVQTKRTKPAENSPLK